MPRNTQRSPSPQSDESRTRSPSPDVDTIMETAPLSPSPGSPMAAAGRRVRQPPRMKRSEHDANVAAKLASLTTAIDTIMARLPPLPQTPERLSPAVVLPLAGTHTAHTPAAATASTSDTQPTFTDDPAFLEFLGQMYRDREERKTDGVDHTTPLIVPLDSGIIQRWPTSSLPATVQQAARPVTSGNRRDTGSPQLRRPASPCRSRPRESAPSRSTESTSQSRTSRYAGGDRRRTPSPITDPNARRPKSPARDDFNGTKTGEATFSFDLNIRTGKVLKGAGKFHQRRPFMALPTTILTQLEERPALDHLSPIEYVLGTLNLIDDMKVRGLDVTPYETHLREVVQDANMYEWSNVRTWTNEVYQKLENRQINWDSSEIQRERARVSWSSNTTQKVHDTPVPCHNYNTMSDTVRCKHHSGHLVGGVPQVHTCILCFYIKGMTKSQHTAKTCFSNRGNDSDRHQGRRNDRSQYQGNNSQSSDNRQWNRRPGNNNNKGSSNKAKN